MKRRHSEKGMALVITLMMLAIVTFMAVVFLSLSRRERTNIKIVEEQTTARNMADMGLERAKADMTANMNNLVEGFLGQATNAPIFGRAEDQQHVAIANRAVQRALFGYNLRTSRNFSNPTGFRRADGNQPWNVGYSDVAGNVYDDRDKRLGLTSDDYYQHIANLQYDPRPPVIVTDGKTNENRFYIDLNRNGMFDPSGTFEVTGVNNERYSANTLIAGKGPPYFNAYFSGDPEWIGVLERPDLPHSETNRFVGRYAYIMMPTGKSLDLNFIHNLAVYDPANPQLRYSAGPSPRFSRNQGIGSWEMNLAGFLVDLHTNVWRRNSTTFYNMTTNQSSGEAFSDAVALLQYRLNNTEANLFTPKDIFGANTRWALDYVDMDSDGPIVPYNFYHNSGRPNFEMRNASINPDNDSDVRFWHGAERMEATSEFPDVQRYFKLKTPAATSEQLKFYQRFTNAMSSARTNTYDRYAYYSLLGQMGADSKPALNNKIHLNFVNEPGTISTNLLSWVTNAPNGALPTLIVRSNAIAAVRRNDGGQEYVQRPNNLTNFFLIAANAMLRESLVTNVYLDEFGKWRTNYTIGCTYFQDPSLNTVWQNPSKPRYIVGTPVRPDISITNIQFYHRPTLATAWRPNDQTYTNSEYNAALHRILQLAANIYDSMTNNAGRTGRPQISGSKPDSPSDPYFPTVFRPIYNITSTNILIVGWEPQENADFAIQAAASTNLFVSASNYFAGLRGSSTTNVPVSFYGQPWVIGAKKGWPNFNEFSIETYAQVTRKLEVFKDAAQVGKKVDTNDLQNFANHTRQIYMIGISNTFGLEAWNSYARTNQRQLRLIAEIQAEYGIDRIRRDANSNIVAITPIPLVQTNPVRRLVRSVNSRNWPGRKGDRPLDEAFPNKITADGGSDFRVPIYEMLTLLTNSEYSDFPQPRFYQLPATFQSLKETPELRVNITNRIRYLAVDIRENRVIDYVTMDNLVTTINMDEALRGEQNYGNAVATGGQPDPTSVFWNPFSVSKSSIAPELTQGVVSQIQAGTGELLVADNIWKDYSAFAQNEKEIQLFSDFMNGVTTNDVLKTNITRQVPFAPMRRFYLSSAYQANDPFVHYTPEDLRDFTMSTRPKPVIVWEANKELGKRNTKRWAVRNDKKHGIEFQDPRMFTSDDWQFPVAKLDDPNEATAYGARNFNYRFPSIGALGQIHRGTPWQTIYLKGLAAPNIDPRTVTSQDQAPWILWAGSYGTHPTNDWKLVGLFTTAITESAARGLLSVNQTGNAAWSAVLSGIPVITNSLSDQKAAMNLPPRFGIPNNPSDAVGARDLLIEPGSVQVSNIVRSINEYRAYRPMGLFSYLGEVLGTPRLSVGMSPDPTRTFLQASPYLHVNDSQTKTDGNPDWHAFTDEAVEAIPARILSLLKEDEPRVTIYCFGQTLKPAPRSYVTSADFYNLCVNYQVTGEYVTKAVVRVEGEFDPRDRVIENDTTINAAQKETWRRQRIPLRAVVESFEVLAPFE